MADLGNQKIKDTYQLVLQTDASGNLQNLSGGTPYPFIFNSGFTSNAGTLFGLGTNTPNETLTVVGDISGTTDLHIRAGVSYLGNLEISGQYLRYASNNRIFFASSPSASLPNILYGYWGMQDNGHLYFGTGEDLDIYHNGTNSYIDNDTGSLYITSSELYLGDTTSETNVQSNLTVKSALTVDRNVSLYVDASTGFTGMGTSKPDYKLTISGTGLDDWNTWASTGLPAPDELTIPTGNVFQTYDPAGIAVPPALSASGTEVRIIYNDDGTQWIEGMTAYGGSGCYGFCEGRIYIGVEWGGSELVLDDLEAKILFRKPGCDNHFAVYHKENSVVGTGTTKVALQVSGTTIMSGSTDLLNIFSTTATTINGGTF